MGMYDELRFEKSPIEDKPQITRFQTKSLDCVLDEYVITEDKKLKVQEYSLRKTERDEQILIDSGYKETYFPQFIRENKGLADLDITCTIDAYTIDENTGDWYDVKIIVVYGKVDKIEITKNDNKKH